ncbi:anti-phage dCTP deaminase [Kangiella taiwanensis]|uniref:CMP/dCMP-type deaminase domain-containing protein n=1 Tax=Kangiella taiwanensis TaxID=1079179 RepID=A0ABP8I4Y9_9GAMM|nr:anti-phage dCTP deaminase [Kangiella taiwanensis]
MSLKFTGNFEELQEKLSKLSGEWDGSQPNKKVLKLDGGILNWYQSTGTIQFQGKDPGKQRLSKEVPILLYPQEVEDQPEKLEESEYIQEEKECLRSNINSAESIEKKLLTTGVNESELVLGVVSAVGTEVNRVTEPLKDRLKGFGYHVEEIRVSSILTPLSGTDEYERIRHYMSEGDSSRETSGDNAILAAGVSKEISKSRNPDRGKTAYIVNSLKHPREVEFLRKIYGNGFYLIGIHADEKRRHKFLTEDKGCTQEQAQELIIIDEDESLPHGQKTRDTYHLADFFLNLGSNNDHVKYGLQRFLELIFSHPYKNPTFDEFAMFMAFNSSVRSGDLSRQVGAVISKEKQIIATGANDVPKSGGGLYWAEADEESGEVKDHPDGKDYTREADSNKQAQSEIIDGIVQKLTHNKLVSDENKDELRKLLLDSKISDLTEFGRIAHAEMDALLSCSRAGIPTEGTTLYCTTFPCHNCAKHIIASGVTRVVYVEPYPKSRALEFHSESIELRSELESLSQTNNLVSFEPFIGIGPRRFLDLFSMSLGSGSKLRRKEKDGSVVEWSKDNAPIRTPLIPKSYIDIEKAAIELWESYKNDGKPF